MQNMLELYILIFKYFIKKVPLPPAACTNLFVPVSSKSDRFNLLSPQAPLWRSARRADLHKGKCLKSKNLPSIEAYYD